MDRKSKILFWPLAAFALAYATDYFLAHAIPELEITPCIIFAAFFGEVVLFASLGASPIGARASVLIGGVALALPGFVWRPGLERFFLACLLILPFLGACELLRAPVTGGFRARLARFYTIFDSRRIHRRARRFEARALLTILVATGVLAGAIAIVKNVPAVGLWYVLRWFFGGVTFLAAGEVCGACHDLFTSALGLTVPALMRSPWRANSLNDFWSKRWNVYTSEIFHQYFYQPLARYGMATALFATFTMSAFGHYCVVLLVIGDQKLALLCGLFFLIQAPLILIEHQLKLKVKRSKLNVGRYPPYFGFLISAFVISSPLIIEPYLHAIEPLWGPPNDVLDPTLAVLGFVIALNGVIALSTLAVQPKE